MQTRVGVVLSYKEYYHYTLLMDTGNHSKMAFPAVFATVLLWGDKEIPIPHKEIPISSAYWQVLCPL